MTIIRNNKPDDNTKFHLYERAIYDNNQKTCHMTIVRDGFPDYNSLNEQHSKKQDKKKSHFYLMLASDIVI
jgi:hypothetical protein